MDNSEYRAGLAHLVEIYQQIDTYGMMAAIQHKHTLQTLAPAILQEAARREGVVRHG